MRGFIIACGLCLLLGGCRVGRAARKVVSFTLRTTGKVALTTTKIVGRTAVKGVSKAVDLTADATLSLLASRRGREIATDFWLYTQGKEYHLAYRLFSPALRSLLPENDFIRQASQWAGTIRKVQVLDGIVRQHHVEVPTTLLLNVEGKEVEVPVDIHVVQEDEEWKIDGWEVKT
ncbi:MAG: hypothetical protein NZT92_13030 [Abditibacteriales bacterium]|nr:hypothetical protein [Abditibacteriales bacterium]MDW8364357.1 hypothetical protein [Abditibacteriales bacterium]